MIFVSPHVFILNIILLINNLIKNIILPIFFISFSLAIAIWLLWNYIFPISVITILASIGFIGYINMDNEFSRKKKLKEK